MITRAEYMRCCGSKSRDWHQEYYSEIARDLGISMVGHPDLAVFREALASGDKHLNNVPGYPLRRFDVWATSLVGYGYRTEALAARGESWSLSTGVCIIKAAIRDAVECDQ